MEPTELLLPTIDDEGVRAVFDEVRELDPGGARIAGVFRETFDQLYDGQRTGRYKLDQLNKTEKAHFGTIFEINLQKALGFSDGALMDFLIAGREVDCKYSHSANWMLPTESFSQIVLVATADDLASRWRLGVVRVTEKNRRGGANRDSKTGLSAFGKSQIAWIFQDAPMQPNVLLKLPREDVDAIMDSAKSGQARVNELLRRATELRITRNIVATVAQQKDPMKRLRENGGSRGALRPEGYLVLGGDYKIQVEIARRLLLPEPLPGEVVSVRVVPSRPGVGVELEGAWWRKAKPDEGSTVPAPKFPRKSEG